MQDEDIYQQMVDELDNCNELARFKIAANIDNDKLTPIEILDKIREIKEKARGGIHYDE